MKTNRGYSRKKQCKFLISSTTRSSQVSCLFLALLRSTVGMSPVLPSRTSVYFLPDEPHHCSDVTRGVMKFLAPKSTHSFDNEYMGSPLAYDSWVIFDLILNNFYWRNTKQSTSENVLPPYTNKVILLDFHPIEKALLADALKEVGTDRSFRLPILIFGRPTIRSL